MWSKAQVFVLLNYDLQKLRNHKIWNMKFTCIEIYSQNANEQQIWKF